MSTRTYLILHGWQGSEPEHWQSWLANRLRAAKESVLYPLLPSPNTPFLEKWIDALIHYRNLMVGEKIVVCHSLGAILWMHYAVSFECKVVDRLLLVSPPCPPELALINEVQGFLPVPMDPEAISNSAHQVKLVCSVGDEYCQVNATITYAQPLKIDYEILPPEAGHINVESNYGPWPQVEKWCYDPSVRFTDQSSAVPD
jgi:predicted alpha/beta hydrolase family esterase